MTGDLRGADSAVRAGLRVIQRHQATLAATELRAHAAEHGAELAALGVSLAIRSGRAERVLVSADRWRANALVPRPVRPPSDEVLVQQLDRLRSVRRELDEASRAGRPVLAIERRQATLEKAVRERARLVGSTSSELPTLPPVRELRARLGNRALVEYVESGGRLHAVVLTAEDCRLAKLGRVADIRHEIRLLTFALRRLALIHLGQPLSPAAALRSAVRSGELLSTALLRPLRPPLGDRPLVIVPTTALHGLPWAALPELTDRPVTVAPSAAQWSVLPDRPPPPTTVTLVAGPGLPYALREVTEIARLYPAARVLTGEHATVAAVLDALDGADLGHVSAHGLFRSDNPLLSQLRLHDGPLTVYDLDALRRPPACLLLAACDVGSAEVLAGDELMGVAAALVSMGTRSVVATSLSVPDDLACQLMIGLHRLLRAGEGAAAALARARCALQGDEPGPLSAFTCFSGD